MNSRERAKKILAQAGITINGAHTYDLQIHERLYDRIFSGGTLALGESYMDGQWNVGDPAEFTSRILRSDFSLSFLGIGIIGQMTKSKLQNLQSHRHAFEVGEKHYDIGSNLYRSIYYYNNHRIHLAFGCAPTQFAARASINYTSNKEKLAV